jgi:hypothetical protein
VELFLHFPIHIHGYSLIKVKGKVVSVLFFTENHAMKAYGGVEI